MAELCDLFMDFFEDDLVAELSTSVVPPALMLKIESASETFRLERIPKEQRIISDDWLEDSEKENSHPNANALKEPSTDVLRFGKNVTNEEELEVYSKGFVPKNTDNNTSWALRNWEAWCIWSKSKNPEEPVPTDLLEAKDPMALNHWLSLYVMETRRKDGKKFPSSTLDCLLRGLYLHARKLNPSAINFFD